MDEKIKRRIELVKEGYKGEEIEKVLLKEEKEKEKALQKEQQEKEKKELEENKELEEKEVEEEVIEPEIKDEIETLTPPGLAEFIKTAIIKKPSKHKERIDESTRILIEEISNECSIRWFKINTIMVSKKYMLLTIYGQGNKK